MEVFEVLALKVARAHPLATTKTSFISSTVIRWYKVTQICLEFL